MGVHAAKSLKSSEKTMRKVQRLFRKEVHIKRYGNRLPLTCHGEGEEIVCSYMETYRSS